MPLGYEVPIQFATNRKTGFRRGVGDQFDGDQQTGERRRAPVLSDVAEHAVLDLVPLRGPRRIMAHLHDETGFVGKLL